MTSLHPAYALFRPVSREWRQETLTGHAWQLDEGFMRQVRLGSRIRLDEEPEEDGEERYGVVVDIRDDGVSIDANEELVGKTLIVHVTILQLEVKGTGNGLS
eukprot:3608843-Rhodomonas_salina.2